MSYGDAPKIDAHCLHQSFAEEREKVGDCRRCCESERAHSEQSMVLKETGGDVDNNLTHVESIITRVGV